MNETQMKYYEVLILGVRYLILIQREISEISKSQFAAWAL